MEMQLQERVIVTGGPSPEDLLDEWLTLNYRGVTADQYRQVILSWFRWLSDHPEADPRTVDGAVAWARSELTRDVKVSTVERKRGIIATFVDYLVSKGAADVRVNPFKGQFKVSALADEDREGGNPRQGRRVLKPGEVARLKGAAAAPGGVVALRDEAMLTLLLHTGMRLNEGLRLREGDVRWNEAGDYEVPGIVRKGRTERGARRETWPVVPAKYAAPLRRWHAARAELQQLSHGGDRVLATTDIRPLPSGAPLFFSCDVNNWGDRLTRPGFYKVWEKLRERATIPEGITPHYLRHSFATYAAAGGAPVRDIQLMLGHRSEGTTLGYIHLDDLNGDRIVASHYVDFTKEVSDD